MTFDCLDRHNKTEIYGGRCGYPDQGDIILSLEKALKINRKLWSCLQLRNSGKQDTPIKNIARQ